MYAAWQPGWFAGGELWTDLPEITVEEAEEAELS